jgi:large conductance mechanosensitive channel
MFKEFRTFIAQGNVLDLAVGLVIGAAFGKITTSLVEDILNPILGLALGGVDFSQLKVVLQAATAATATTAAKAEVAIHWGNFVNTIIQFLLVAYVIFLIIKAANRAKLSDSMAPKE